jgi:hypothetical protein
VRRIARNLFLGLVLYAGLTAVVAVIETPLGWGSPGLETAVKFAAFGALFMVTLGVPALILLAYDLSLRAIPGWWHPRSKRIGAVGLALGASAACIASIRVMVAPYPGVPLPSRRASGSGSCRSCSSRWRMVPWWDFPTRGSVAVKAGSWATSRRRRRPAVDQRASLAGAPRRLVVRAARATTR